MTMNSSLYVLKIPSAQFLLVISSVYGLTRRRLLLRNKYCSAEICVKRGVTVLVIINLSNQTALN